MIAKTLFPAAAASILLTLTPAHAHEHEHEHEGDWVELFDGETLDGWSTKGGAAPFEVVDGVIVGTAVPNTPNTFLTTDTIYDDFIFEIDVKVEGGLNSGVMFRADARPDYRNGRVHGFQAELDNSPRRWSGGIFEEQMRGWLYPLTRNPSCQNAFKRGEWNSYRIEALGDTVQIVLNDTPCSRLLDPAGRTEGFFGLQVHSVGNNPAMGASGDKANFRNMRIKTDIDADDLTVFPANIVEINSRPNTLSKREVLHGWQLLWDGETTQGWRSARGENFPERGWRIADGMLMVEASDGGESTNGGDIITTDEYSDFELQLQFRITPGANSGIKYFVDPDLLKGEGSAIGLEFQILDDELHPDANMGVAGKRKTGSLYDLIRADNLSEIGMRRAKRNLPAGQWNHARIVSRGGHITHYLNHVKVVEYDRFSQTFAALVEYSKYADWENFGRWPTGPILLQDHGDEVAFRSIKIRELTNAEAE